MKIKAAASIFFFCVVLPLFVYAGTIETRLIDLDGPVFFHISGTSSDQLIQAINNAPLEEGDQVITGRGGTARIVVNGDSIFELGSESEFTVQKLQDDTLDFFLGKGNVLAKIKSFFEKKKSMRVRTPVAVASVRGTELAVAFDSNTEKSDIGVFDEGQVEVESSGTGEKVNLAPGEETEVVKGLPPIAPRRLENLRDFRGRLGALRVRRDTAWKNWKTSSLEERKAFREKLRQERVIQKHDLPHLQPAPLEKKGKMIPKNRPQPLSPRERRHHP